MASVTRFLEERLKLRVNRKKSAVDRPWRRSFLGYQLTFHRQPRLTLAPTSLRRLIQRVQAVFRRGRGGSFQRVLKELAPVLRGWASYYRRVDVKRPLETLDGWIRRRLRCLLWRQWKRVYPRVRRLMKLGLPKERAWRSATNGRGHGGTRERPI